MFPCLDSCLLTAESVSCGHPDKICDIISDALLDAYLKKDPSIRTAIEVLVTTKKVILAGEVSAPLLTPQQTKEIVRQTLKEIGYEQSSFHWATVEISNFIHSQSHDIATGIKARGDKSLGAGDQGLMFGYATDETLHFMPAPIFYAHEILKHLKTYRQNTCPLLYPDAKCQVTLLYEQGCPQSLHSAVISSQHSKDMPLEEVRSHLKKVLKATLPKDFINDTSTILPNPAGNFIIGGPDGDTGLTGRKIMVDTYGGYLSHGGGSFSGKDATKVDRSGAYMARYIAKNLVASGLAQKCLIQLSYAIGLAEPVALYCDFLGTGKISEERVKKALPNLLDLTPSGIIKHLNLQTPFYKITASYGHFGRKPTEQGAFPWEKESPSLQEALLRL